MAGPAEIGAWLGLANALCLFVTSSVRQRRLDYADVAPAGVAFLSSLNLWPPCVLFWFAANEQARATLPPTLAGYEKFLGLAAICSFLASVVSIASLYRKAWTRTGKRAR